MSAPDRRALLDRADKTLSVRRQCALARRGAFGRLSGAQAGQRQRRGADAPDRRAVHRLALSRLAADGGDAARGGRIVNRKRVQRLMRLMGIAALGPKPRTSKPAPGHRIYPYLLRNLTIDAPNHVWAADITYIPIGRGFLYLVAIIDWASRAVLAWRLSNTMDVSFCVEALEEALARFGKPEIFNTDQGSQFTSRRLHRRARSEPASHLDGRPRPLDGQRVHRAAVAVAEVRGHLSQGLRRRPRSRAPGSPLGSPSTTAGARTRRSATARQWRSGAKATGALAPRPWT